jgi:hypothetical protein
MDSSEAKHLFNETRSPLDEGSVSGCILQV